jgi:hypothetical protein
VIYDPSDIIIFCHFQRVDWFIFLISCHPRFYAKRLPTGTKDILRSAFLWGGSGVFLFFTIIMGGSFLDENYILDISSFLGAFLISIFAGAFIFIGMIVKSVSLQLNFAVIKRILKIWPYKKNPKKFMTKDELTNRLIQENIPPSLYSLNGGMPEDRFCIGSTYGGWEVYYSKRGVKSQVKKFFTEEEAHDYLYAGIKRMMKKV